MKNQPNNQLFLNEDNLTISQEFINQTQNLINNNSYLNNYLLSFFLNHDNINSFIQQLIERLLLMK